MLVGAGGGCCWMLDGGVGGDGGVLGLGLALYIIHSLQWLPVQLGMLLC